MTKTAREQAKQIKSMRDSGSTWAEVTETVGLSETTARKRLQELDEELASSNGKAAKVEPTKIETKQDTEKAMAAILKGEATADDFEVEPKPKAKKPKASKKDDAGAKPVQRSGRYLKLTCDCGYIIRTSKTVAAAATIKCTECKKPFTEAA